MIRTTPFHPRLSELNTQGLYTHWQGYLSPLRYSDAPKHEYFAVRNSVGVFDTSPLLKYRVAGPDAERFLAGMLVRDVRACPPGRAQYTVWCDDDGFVMEDGVVFRHGPDEFLLTAARPVLGWLDEHRGRLRVTLEDESDEHAMLAVQGPRSRAVLGRLMPEADRLEYFEHSPAKVGPAAVLLSRTGFTGDLGFEVTVAAEQAVAVLDAVLDAGQGHGLRPFGEEALMTLRIEAGLPLVDVEWRNSRTAWTDEERVTPVELGMAWMLRGIGPDRPFVGRDAIRRELAARTSRWSAVGLVVDWRDWDRVHRDAGLVPPKDDRPLPHETMLYEAPGGARVGYATSFVYSPVLQRHIGLARVRPRFAPEGTTLHLELTLNHAPTTVAVRTARTPLFDAARRTAAP